MKKKTILMLIILIILIGSICIIVNIKNVDDKLYGTYISEDLSEEIALNYGHYTFKDGKRYDYLGLGKAGLFIPDKKAEDTYTINPFTSSYIKLIDDTKIMIVSGENISSFAIFNKK